MTKRISSGYDNGNNKKQSTICDTKNNKQERVSERKREKSFLLYGFYFMAKSARQILLLSC